MISSLQNTPVDWGYTVEKTKKIGNLLSHNISWPSGKFIGGSAGMNVRFYVRGNPREYNEWEYAGNPTWNWENLLQYFKKAENYNSESSAVDNNTAVGGANELHGKSGPLPINYFVNDNPFKQMLFDAARELGHNQIADVNGRQFVGITRAPGTISQGKLFNAAKAYLSPAKDRANLHVIKYAHVTKVNVDPTTGHVSGVVFQVNKTTELTAVSTKETILSAGTIGTPKILQLSGIGPQKHLTRLNIPVVRDLPTGLNLQNHITVPLFIKFNVSDVQASETVASATESETVNPTASQTASTNTESTATPLVNEGGIGSTDALYNYIKQRADISSLQHVFDVLGFFSTVNTPHPNIGTNYAIFKRGDHLFLTEYLRQYGLNETVTQPIIDANQVADVAIVFVTILNPSSHGKVRIRSADPYELPLIHSNVLDRPEDVTNLVQGIQIARSFLQTTPFQQQNASEIILSIPQCESVPVKKKKVKATKPPKVKKGKKNKGAEPITEAPIPVEPEPLPVPIPYGSDQYFECYVKQVSTTLWHPVGTSKMGPNLDRFAVVDSRLKVHGLTGLRVVDASIIPKIMSAPVNAATVAIAEKASDIIKEDWPIVETIETAEPAPAHQEL